MARQQKINTQREGIRDMWASSASSHRISLAVALIVAAVSTGTPGKAGAEVAEVRIAQQYGIGYLPLHVIKHENLVAKHAKAAGLGEIPVRWAVLGGGSAMNDALLSDSVDLVSGGIGALVTIWAKTKGSLDVRGMAALGSLPIALVTSNPAVKTVKDFTDQDRIALPSVKVSIQAVTLQMAAEQAFGPGNQEKLDHLTVSMKHPDALAALLSGRSEITSHFATPPYQEQELAAPGIHKILDSYSVVGSPVTLNSVWAKAAFRDKNPKTYAVVLAALREAMQIIEKDPQAAARIYLAEDESKLDESLVLNIITDSQVRFTTTPAAFGTYTDFMYRTGAIKVKAESWKDVFFPEVHGEAGS